MSTGLSMLPESIYNKKGTINWYYPPWRFNHFCFFWKHFYFNMDIASAALIILVSRWCSPKVNHLNRFCKSDITCCFFHQVLIKTLICSHNSRVVFFPSTIINKFACLLHIPLRLDLPAFYIFFLLLVQFYCNVRAALLKLIYFLYCLQKLDFFPVILVLRML